MEGGGMGKCSKIRHIVRLRQMLRRWRQRAAALSSLRRSAAPPDVPAGHVAVCVGSSSRRFVVLASHLNHPVFRQLLRQAEEEFGFSSGRPGPLSLPCDESLFQRVVHFISSSASSTASSTSRSQNSNLDVVVDDDTEMLLHYSVPSSTSSCCCDLRRWLNAADSLPLLHGHRLADKPVW
ncbi:auxin-induced protein 6B [Canna indica]|uniref:Auxin-induced protein 6B n=1 Tax=Canna indica TaxID=4628 RepID=A0AAQ3L625_9LILI|nr:auxin-induced protein 6B [Canna indica]